jgi:cyclohexanone monooxygenase
MATVDPQILVVSPSLADVAPPLEAQVPPNWRDMNVDFKQLAAKYNEERVKRLQKAGIEQYQHVATTKLGVLPEMVDDPFAEPIKRESVTEDHDIVIIGGGVGGVIMACRLVKAGFQNIKIVEKAGDFGGVW